MKIDVASLTRTHLGFPSEWEGKTTDGKTVKLSYRCGRTRVIVEDKIVATLSIDQFDIGGFMEDDTLLKLLKQHGYIE